MDWLVAQNARTTQTCVYILTQPPRITCKVTRVGLQCRQNAHRTNRFRLSFILNTKTPKLFLMRLARDGLDNQDKRQQQRLSQVDGFFGEIWSSFKEEFSVDSRAGLCMCFICYSCKYLTRLISSLGLHIRSLPSELVQQASLKTYQTLTVQSHR